MKEYCEEDSIKTVEAALSKSVRFVGDYCKKDVKFVGCIQKAKTACIFSSKLARIVQEQERRQLKRFGLAGGWGSTEEPNCEGFTLEEFQALDFSQIDFTEFLGDIKTDSQEDVELKVKEKIDAFYDGF